MTIRLLVLDVDGTIAGVSNEISPRVKAAVAAVQKKGVKVAIATGRMYCSALYFHKALNSQQPLIAYNGGWLENPLNQKVFFRYHLEGKKVRELLDYFRHIKEERSNLDVHLYCQDQLYVEEINQRTLKYAERSRIKPNLVKDFEALFTEQITKILAFSEDVNLIKELTQRLQQKYQPEEIYLTQSSDTYLEANPPGIHKGSAVQFLTEKVLGYKPENVMAIGDNFNDIEMLEYAGLGVAMGEADDTVKKSAQWVAPSVEEDGAAIAIEHFLLNKP